MYAVKYKLRYMCTDDYYTENPDSFFHRVPLIFKYNGNTGVVCFFSD